MRLGNRVAFFIGKCDCKPPIDRSRARGFEVHKVCHNNNQKHSADPPKQQIFSIKILGGHVASRNQGLTSYDQGRQRREILGTRWKTDRPLAMLGDFSDPKEQLIQSNLRLQPPLVSDHLSSATSFSKCEKFPVRSLYLELLACVHSRKRLRPLLERKILKFLRILTSCEWLLNRFYTKNWEKDTLWDGLTSTPLSEHLSLKFWVVTTKDNNNNN